MEYSVINPNGKLPVLRIKVSGVLSHYSIMGITGISYAKLAMPLGSVQVTIDREGTSNIFQVPAKDVPLIDEIVTLWINTINQWN
ncbi:hypothetical protein TOTORO_03230 [Serratia phage vB_SmaS-Totoro]|nr:hypothetical protein TOTORO_03230 [Serratia phage vB_SmaS-Totoro]